jgi:Family of unknown function (DUF5941)
MTVALVLAVQPDAGLRGQLTALGVRRVDAAEQAGPGLLAVVAAARAAGERVLICVGDDTVPEEILTRLLGAGTSTVYTGLPTTGTHRGGALVVDVPDLDALAGAAQSLAARRPAPAPPAPLARSTPAEPAPAKTAPAQPAPATLATGELAPGELAPGELGTLLTELARRGTSVHVLDAGPEGDGAVAQLIADPVARPVARWAARRELAPAPLYGISLGFGLLAAAWFAGPSVRHQGLGIAALFLSFLVGRAAFQLAATEGTGPAVDWLGVAAGMLTEFAVYAALAIGSGLAAHNNPATAAGLNGIFGDSLQHTLFASWGGAGQAGVWRLAVAAMVLLAARRLAEVGYEALARTSGKSLPRPARRLFGQVITLPAGERIVVIAVSAVLFGPRLTFLILLAWGAVAAGYVLAGQLADASKLVRVGGMLPAYRGDGPLAHRIGGVVRGQLPPLPPLLVGLLVTCDLAYLGVANLSGLLVLGPVAAMLLAALGARHPHDGRLDWLVPSLLLAGEAIFLTSLGFARQVWLPMIFVLLAAVAMRHADIAYRARAGRGIPADKFGLGWDGRMLVAGFAAVFGIVPFAYAALAAWLWLLTAWDFLGAWLKSAN